MTLQRRLKSLVWPLVAVVVGTAGTLALSSAAAVQADGNLSWNGAAGKSLPASDGMADPFSLNNRRPASSATKNDCPPGVKCQVVPAALADNGCNYSIAQRPEDTPIIGITEHTTEGSLQAALSEAQDSNNCVSWNYLVGQDGTVYVSVPPADIAYDAGNWYVNSQYVQVEHVGSAEDCSTLTSAEYKASTALDRYLIQRYHIHASAATIFGHDSVPGTDDAHVASMHWDPGVCWPWNAFLAAVGAPVVPSAAPTGDVVTVYAPQNQPVQDCPGAQFTGCVAAAQTKTNFLTLYTAPSTSAPLLSDPYLHTDGSAGSIAMEDWGDKAPVGHQYVVAERKPGWTAIWYAGQKAWFPNRLLATVGSRSAVVTPKSLASVVVYGRPMPEDSAGGFYYDGQNRVPLANGWCAASQTPVAGTAQDCIPADLKPGSALLSKYHIAPGQQYAVAQMDTPDRYVEGCDNSTCTYPGDNVVVVGHTTYIGIWFNHRLAYVKAADVTVTSKG
jgi:N-acetyl-anhydromuramyl-L-alanine amidase AmpD